MTTLAKVNTQATTIDLPDASSSITSEMTMLMPPGFTEPVSRPMVFIGGEVEGGSPFYTWNHDDSTREYVPVNRFSARVIEVKTIIKNADDETRRAVKLVVECETATGQRVALSCGAKTYAAMGIIAGLNKLTADELSREVGLSGKVGRGGKVTFVSVFSDGKLIRDPNSEDLLKEAKKDDTLVETIESYVKDINENLTA